MRTRQPTPIRPEEGPERDRLIEYLKLARSPKNPILIPSIVLGEYLMGVISLDRQQESARIARDFGIILAVDVEVAEKAAEIRLSLGDRSFQKSLQESGSSKQCIKADI